MAIHLLFSCSQFSFSHHYALTSRNSVFSHDSKPITAHVRIPSCHSHSFSRSPLHLHYFLGHNSHALALQNALFPVSSRNNLFTLPTFHNEAKSKNNLTPSASLTNLQRRLLVIPAFTLLEGMKRLPCNKLLPQNSTRTSVVFCRASRESSSHKDNHSLGTGDGDGGGGGAGGGTNAEESSLLPNTKGYEEGSAEESKEKPSWIPGWANISFRRRKDDLLPLLRYLCYSDGLLPNPDSSHLSPCFLHSEVGDRIIAEKVLFTSFHIASVIRQSICRFLR